MTEVPPAPARSVTERPVLHLGREGPREAPDAVAVEEPLEIRVDGDTVAVTMRTPGRDADLALGFLFAEGLIAGAEDVGTVAHCGRPGEEGYGNVLDVRSGAGGRIDAERVLEGRRWVTTSAACGVCGRRSIDGLLERCGAVDASTRIPAELVAAAVGRLGSVQPAFARTGGLHAAAISAADGTLLSAAEDVGRHNAVDKAVGALLRVRALGASRHAPPGPAPALLAVSGRTSFEIVQKAAAARLAVVAGVSAPSSLAVDLAENMRIALLGFVRDGRLNVYSNRWRLDAAAPAPRVGSPASP